MDKACTLPEVTGGLHVNTTDDHRDADALGIVGTDLAPYSASRGLI